MVNPFFNNKFIIYIYNYLLKKWVNYGHFSHFYFLNGFMIFCTSSNGNLSNDTEFLKKKILLSTG